MIRSREMERQIFFLAQVPMKGHHRKHTPCEEGEFYAHHQQDVSQQGLFQYKFFVTWKV